MAADLPRHDFKYLLPQIVALLTGPPHNAWAQGPFLMGADYCGHCQFPLFFAPTDTDAKQTVAHRCAFWRNIQAENDAAQRLVHRLLSISPAIL
jgi:hypothetical protein